MAPPRQRHIVLDDPDELAARYRSAGSIAGVAELIAVSASTVRRAMVRHGIDRFPRNWNRRPRTADALDDRQWLTDRYQTMTGVAIARELSVSPRTVYAAMQRHGISRRVNPGGLALRRGELADSSWLHDAVESKSSNAVADVLDVSPGTVTTAYRRVGIDPTSTVRLYERGRSLPRPSAAALRDLWDAEGTYRGVGDRLGVAHTTAATWLAEADVFSTASPALNRTELLDAIEAGWPLSRIAGEHRVSVTTVKVELHRHRLLDAHRTRHRRRSGR